MERLETFINLPNGNYDQDYLKNIVEICMHADQYEFDGVLLHFNHQMIDPFALGSYIMNHTRNISPILAIQPNYIDPIAAAKMVQSLTYLYGRKLYLNMIVGAAQYEFEQVHDESSRAKRYMRLDEYITVLKKLLSSNHNLEFSGEFYRYSKLKLSPDILDENLLPTWFVAGSSAESISIAKKHNNYIVTHPQPVEKYKELFGSDLSKKAIKIGVIARDSSDLAWEVATKRYEPSFEGKVSLQLKKKSESNWLRLLAELGSEQELYDEVYWMGGFNCGEASNPILVGSIDKVANYIRKYLQSGVRAIIFSNLLDKDDFEGVYKVISSIKENEVGSR